MVHNLGDILDRAPPGQIVDRVIDRFQVDVETFQAHLAATGACLSLDRAPGACGRVSGHRLIAHLQKIIGFHQVVAIAAVREIIPLQRVIPALRSLDAVQDNRLRFNL